MGEPPGIQEFQKPGIFQDTSVILPPELAYTPQKSLMLPDMRLSCWVLILFKI